jgi:hypothetical protein
MINIMRFRRRLFWKLGIKEESHFLTASFGGIVGLCMGFSLLSGAEFIYFFTIRMWIDVWRGKKMKNKTSLG